MGQERPQTIIAVEIPPAVQKSYRERCRTLLKRYTQETQTQLRNETPGSIRILAYEDSAVHLQATGHELLATRDYLLAPDTTGLSHLINCTGERAAIDETRRTRKQEVQQYPGYDEALQKSETIIDNAYEALKTMFLPPLGRRTTHDDVTAEAEAAIFLGGLLKKIVDSPKNEITFT